MSLTLAIALYFVIWWTTLFAVLPIGVRTQGEAGEVVPGTPSSAPVRPRVLWIIGVNTAVASVVFLLALSAIVFNWIPIDRGPPGQPGL